MRRVLSALFVKYRQQRQVLADHEALRSLDDRTLHDLGFERDRLTAPLRQDRDYILKGLS